LILAARIPGIFSRLTDDRREDLLIIDDSTYDRSRSKKVESHFAIGPMASITGEYVMANRNRSQIKLRMTGRNLI